LYVPFNAPHSASNLDPKIRSGPQAPEKYKAMYPHLQAKAGYVERIRYGKPALTANAEQRKLEYAASITCMDDAIGQLLDLLDEYKIAEDTIVIFFSDNGGGGGSDNSPLRGHKGEMYEGGIRVPCIVRYPRQIPAGGISDEFLTSLEILPTLLKLANVQPPRELTLDGSDMLPVLAKGAPSPRAKMFWQRKDLKAARVGNWKWVETPKGGGLFNLDDDIAEQNDLATKQPDKLNELKTAFVEWRKEMDAAEPRGPFRDY
jgi:arylsulfatase A-like enzyme